MIRKKKILFFIWALEVGGAERLLVKLVRRIPRDAYDVKVVCVAREWVWAQEVRDAGIEILCLEKKTGFDPGVLLRAMRVIRAERPDIVNTHLWTADTWGRIAAILCGVPHIIVTEQNVDVWKRWYHRLIDRILFLKTRNVICVSDQVVEFYSRGFGLSREKLRMIPNAIDTSAFEGGADAEPLRREMGFEDNDFLFACVARLHPQKGHAVLIRAVETLLRDGVDRFRILLVGDGDLRAELERTARSGKGRGHIRFLGQRQDIPRILSQCDAFVLPSFYEGLPLAVLEAMAAGLPVVATRVGGTPQAVQDGTTGILVAPDDPAMLADAMRRMMADPPGARKMGEEGRRLVRERYGIERIATETTALFDSCFPETPKTK